MIESFHGRLLALDFYPRKRFCRIWKEEYTAYCFLPAHNHTKEITGKEQPVV
jgi:hypothetical protein